MAPMAPAEQTISVALRNATDLLQSASTTPRLDAELLLVASTTLSRTAVNAFPERVLDERQWQQFSRLVARRAQGEPLAYLLGSQEFWSLCLAVSPAVLIPRPETELIVERALKHLPAASIARVLDLATGSGAIALAIASERPKAIIVATDISETALEVARSNAARIGLERVAFRAGNWFAPLANERFSLIASNPPYIAEGDPDLEPAVLAFEPRIALIAGLSGWEALTHIAAQAPRHLEPGGWLVLEHGWRQAPNLRNLLEQAGFRHVRSHADLAGHERVTEGQWVGKREESGQRTADSTDPESNSD